MRPPDNVATITGAKYSPCRQWRYLLWRRWSDGPAVNFILLNPWRTDEKTGDPTIERCQRMAAQLGYGALNLTNLFGLCATHPLDLYAAPDPVGPGNDAALRVAAAESDLVICGWGNHGKHRNRSREVVAMLAERNLKLHALYMTRDNEPGQPLYLGYGRKPTRFA